MKKNLTLLIALAGMLVSCEPKSEMDRFIDELMGRMTLEQKIGQLNLHSAPGFRSSSEWTSSMGMKRCFRCCQLHELLQ